MLIEEAAHGSHPSGVQCLVHGREIDLLLVALRPALHRL
jgi:hypothetical protein